MKLTEAFEQLDLINESANTDEYSQILADIEKLDNEIRTLQGEKAKSWNSEYSKKFEQEAKELNDLRRELYKLIKSYQYVAHVWYDEDGHADYDYEDDPELKAKVADQEAELRARLTELEAQYEKIVQGYKDEHEKAFAGHTADIAAKTQVLDDKKTRKKAVFADIVEEVRPELEELINRIGEGLSVDWKHISINNGQLIVPISKSASDSYVDDYYDFDTDDYGPTITFDTEKFEDDCKESALEDDLPQVAYNLDIPESDIDTWLTEDEGATIEIPASTWLLCNECYIEAEEPHIRVGQYYGDGWNEPRELDYEYDSDVTYHITYYLIKKI